jgi:hypothetical protein
VHQRDEMRIISHNTTTIVHIPTVVAVQSEQAGMGIMPNRVVDVPLVAAQG